MAIGNTKLPTRQAGLHLMLTYPYAISCTFTETAGWSIVRLRADYNSMVDAIPGTTTPASIEAGVTSGGAHHGRELASLSSRDPASFAVDLDRSVPT